MSGGKPVGTGRFDYVQYDEHAASLQSHVKTNVVRLETDIETLLPKGRAASLALTALEEVYMWMGKAIRDDQVARNGCAPLQEERTTS